MLDSDTGSSASWRNGGERIPSPTCPKPNPQLPNLFVSFAPLVANPAVPFAADLHRWQTRAEGQFFERKSAFDRSTGRPKHRKAADVAWDVVETLAAMAKADGGELAVGIEDDGTITGVPHGG